MPAPIVIPTRIAIPSGTPSTLRNLVFGLFEFLFVIRAPRVEIIILLYLPAS